MIDPIPLIVEMQMRFGIAQPIEGVDDVVDIDSAAVMPFRIVADLEFLDELAEQAGLDPLELRRLNVNRPGETTPMGLQITTCALDECLERTGAITEAALERAVLKLLKS